MFAIYIIAKNITESIAKAAFATAEHQAIMDDRICSETSATNSTCSPAPYVSLATARPHLKFYLTADDTTIAAPARSRIREYLQHGDLESSDADVNSALQQFVNEHPVWKNSSSSYISIVKNSKLRRAIVTRCQVSGNCFVIAPFLALHYAVNLHSKSLNNYTVDITEYIRKHLDSESLARLLLSNVGSHTNDIIDSVFQPEPGIFKPRVHTFDIHGSTSPGESLYDYTVIRDLLERYGVGIINHFLTHEDFADVLKNSFAGSPVGKELGGHAMVLIGVRYEWQSGEYYLLMQNSWSKLLIVEIKQDYASFSNTKLLFVKSPQTFYPAYWPLVMYKSATTAINAGVLPPR